MHGHVENEDENNHIKGAINQQEKTEEKKINITKLVDDISDTLDSLVAATESPKETDFYFAKPSKNAAIMQDSPEVNWLKAKNFVLSTFFMTK